LEQLLDVSHLEPCEPLERTLEAVAGLAVGDHLRVIHRRDPQLLYPLLERQGFRWITRRGGPAGFEILIWHSADHPTGQALEGATSGDR